MGLTGSKAILAVASMAPLFDLDSLYREHARTVARWVRRLAGPGTDVDDLVQEVFLVVERRLPELDGEGKITTWLYRIAERVVMDARRRDRFRRWFSRARSVEIEQSLSSVARSPLDALERQQAVASLYRVLDRLPERYRTVLILFELEEMSGEEIAALTGLKEATVWTHLHRGRARVLQEMKRALGRES
jgi:RNA polymerase sigma-70 factor (ECF subfamily)